MENNNQLELFDTDMLNLTGTHPTSTVIQSRLPLCNGNKRIATGKNPLNDITIVDEKPLPSTTIINSYGKITIISKRLTQRHKDLMDWIFAYHKNYDINSTGDITYEINAYAMLKDLGIKIPDMRDLDIWLTDLMTAIVKIETQKVKIYSNIVSRFEVINGTDKNTKFGNGQTYKIKFSADFMKIFGNDMQVYYHKLLPELYKLKEAELRSIVRFMFTHENITIGLKNLLETLDIIRKDQETTYINKILRNIRKDIMENAIINKLGISIDEYDNVKYSKHALVYFKNPLSK